MSSDTPNTPRPGAQHDEGAWNDETTAMRPFEHEPTVPLSSPHGSGKYWRPAELPPPVLPPPAMRLPPRPPRPGVSRRKLLIGAGAGAAGIGVLGAGVGLLLSDHAGQHPTAPANLTTDEAGKVLHLLRRAGFGPSPADVDEYVSQGASAAIDRLLDFPSVPDDAVEARIKGLNLDLTKTDDLVRGWVLRMIYSRRPLQEKLTLFWHGVLTSGVEKAGGRKGFPLLAQQNDLLRAKCLGRYDDLIKAISTDPAMLIYLDGTRSTGRSPNENYARELMELFTLGVTDAAGHPNYTQDDVHNGALALSGWEIQNGKGVFVPARHYNGTVTYLGQTGKLGLDDVVKLVCAHPATGRHLAFRMWSFFVYENPSDADLQPLADAYYKSSHSIKAMVEAMLRSPAFFSDKAYRARVKSPVEFVVGAVRALGIETAAKGVSASLRSMGQVPYDPPNVSGWDGDKVSAAWLSTQTWMARVNFVNTLLAATNGAASKQSTTSATTSSLQQVIAARGLKSGAALADYFVAALLDNKLDADRRAILHDAVTNAPSAGGPSLPLAGGAHVPAAGVRSMLYLLMSMPEYQMS
jgi:uncharacterized protein (DUF1800 family)